MRPPVWIGHIDLKVRSLDQSDKFYQALGLRPLFSNDAVCILELRGGTHLILILDENAGASEAAFDFMVESLDESHAAFSAQGLDVGEITRGDIHDWFKLTDPTGNQITVNSTHVDDHSLV